MPISDALIQRITEQSTFVGSVQVLMTAIKDAIVANPNPEKEKQAALVTALTTDDQRLAAALLANTPCAPPVIPG